MGKITEAYNLQTINKILSKEWHLTKNGKLTPKDVTPNSHIKVWWICNSGHEWKATIKNRNNGKGCPFCSGKAVCNDNCLATLNTELAKEWHPTKNGTLTSKDVTAKSNKKVWWICARGHEWEARICHRNKINGSNCPYCRNPKIQKSNS